MGLSIKITQIVPLYPHKIYFQWDLIKPSEHGSYLFTVERCGSTEGPWETIATDLPDSYNYIDDLGVQTLPPDGNVNLYSLARQIYYRVTVTPPSGPSHNVATAPQGLYPAEITPTQRGLRRRLQYDQNILLKRINGVPMVLLKRRRWGIRCTTCYDPVTRATLHEQCPECYGTSFKDGYWTPVLTHGRVYPPTAVNAQTAPQQKIEKAQHNIHLLDVPLLADDDIIVVLATNDRFVVDRQNQTELLRKPVHQVVTVSVLAHGAVEYTIPADTRTIPPLL